jgi:phosphatidylglycerol:prolipoprotein diacylglycerol transferase
LFPYIEVHPLEIGPLKIEPFGTIVGIGCLIGWFLCKWFGKRQRMDPDILHQLLVSVLIWGFLGAHLVDVFGYQPEKLKDDPLLLVKVWNGISSFGGVLGAFIALVLFFRKHRELNFRRWADVIMFGFVPGFWIGRFGCTVVHDHVGAATDSILAVNFPAGAIASIPQGGPHFDLGLIEALFVMPLTWMAMCLPLLFRRRPDGLMTALAAIAYSVPRFFLDFYRREEPDPRYFGLTWGHYLSVATLLAGVYMLYRIYVRKDRTFSDEIVEPAPQAADPKKALKKKPGRRRSKGRRK